MGGGRLFGRAGVLLSFALLVTLVSAGRAAADVAPNWVSASGQLYYGSKNYYRNSLSDSWSLTSGYYSYGFVTWGQSADYGSCGASIFPKPTAQPYVLHMSGYGYAGERITYGLIHSYGTEVGESSTTIIFDTSVPYNYTVAFTGTASGTAWGLSSAGSGSQPAAGILPPGHWTFTSYATTLYGGSYDATLTLTDLPDPSCLTLLPPAAVVLLRRRQRRAT